MKRYARVDDGKVVEIIEPMVDEDDNEIPIEDRFHPDLVAHLVDATGVDGVAPGWDYGHGTFSPPAPIGPAVPQSVTPLQFIERFTESEQIAIVTAAMSSAQLRLWYDKLMAAQEVVFTDSRLSAGLDALVGAGLITADRKAELLTP